MQKFVQKKEVAKVCLNNIKDIDALLQIINKRCADYYLIHGEYQVNAQSSLGILSLDLTNNLTLACALDASEKEVSDLKDELTRNLLVK